MRCYGPNLVLLTVDVALKGDIDSNHIGDEVEELSD
jgi:hypothetical protein